MPAAWEFVKVVEEGESVATPEEVCREPDRISVETSGSYFPNALSSDITKKKFAIVIPTTGSVSIEWVRAFRAMRVPGGGEVLTPRGMPIDVARETAVRSAMDKGFEWIFFLDSDVVVPKDVLEKLSEANLPIVNGMYVAKHPLGHFWDMWIKVLDPAGRVTTGPIVGWKERYVVESDTVGAGCMLVHRSVFETIEKKYPDLPFFYWTYGRKPETFVERLKLPDPLMTRVSEDFWFCLLARACGYRIVTDTTIKCGHLTTTELGEQHIVSQQIETLSGEIERI